MVVARCLFAGWFSSTSRHRARAHHRKERRNRTHECSKRQTSKSSKSHLDALRVRPSRGWRFIRRDKLLRANDNRRRVSAVLQLPFRGQECRGARGDGLTRGVMHHRMFPFGYIYIYLWDKKVATKRRAKGGRARSVVVVASARATTSPHNFQSDDTTLDSEKKKKTKRSLGEKSPHE